MKGKFFLVYSMIAYWAVQLHLFLTFALYGGEWSNSRSGRFTLEKKSGTHRTWGQVSLRSGVGGTEKRKNLLFLS